jgi:hypothetical protein
VTRRLTSALVALSVSATAIGASCSTKIGVTRPDCGTEVLSTLTLMAQSVRGASLVPCLETTPAGWSFVSNEVKENLSKVVMKSDRGGDHALEVRLVEACDTSNAVEIPSDEPGTHRYEDVKRVSPDYEGTRAYVFPGGCVTYQFRLNTDRPSQLINEATIMVGFVTREELRVEIEKATHGAVENGP